MGNVMTMKKLRNKTSREGFDLSRKNIYTAKVGELLPVACVECLPGDSYELKTQHFTRTRPVNTAAYTRIREYYDWFFVPTNLLWNKFNIFVEQMNENNQQATSINSNAVVGDQHPYFSRNDIISFLSQQSNTDYAKKNMFGFSRYANACKLMEYLDYGMWRTSTTNMVNPQTFLDDVALNPFPLLAYQKICSDYYRHSQWQSSFAPMFNINYISGIDDMKIPVPSIAIDATPNMFDLQYANWHKDYFMGLLPNSQYGDVASVNISSLLNNVSQQSLNIWNSSTSSDVITDSSGTLVAGTDASWKLTESSWQNIKSAIGIQQGSVIGAFSILALRNAEAMQKWREITQSQQQDYQSQVEAHFGVKVSDAYSERSTWIGGGNSTIDISEVVNTNLSADNEATIAGKGVGSGEDFCKFETKVHGYLMCIYHAVPLLDYALSGIPRQNLKTFVTDYAIPEFDKTGMVSVPLAEMYSKEYNRDESANLPELLGYAPRYYDYKTSYDRVHGGFNEGGFDAWVAPVSSDYLRNIILSSLNTGSDDGTSINYEFFKVNPSFLNPIFDLDADDYVDSDQLLINSYFDIKAVRNLDRDGLPY